MLTELAQEPGSVPAEPAQIAETVPTATSSDTTSSLFDACGSDPSTVCRWVFERTDNSFLAIATDWVVERPLRLTIILIGAIIVNRLIKRAISHLAERLAHVPEDDRLEKLRERGPGKFLFQRGDASKRAAARAKTISTVLTSVSGFAIWMVALFMMLGELGINIAPLIAGAGIAGVALGFGAQTIVRDFLSGLFMVVEDQFGVGDIINTGEVSGTVEEVSLRTVTVREVTGTVWHIPNGEIKRIGNFSQLWSRALLDIEVAYNTDLRLAEGVIQRVANDMWQDAEWGGDELMEEPEVWGIQNLGADGVAIRLVIKTQPSTQWAVERELRLRIKEAFDEAGIEIPFPQRTVWVRHEGDYKPPDAPDKAEIQVAEVPRYRIDHSETDEPNDKKRKAAMQILGGGDDGE